VATCTIRRSKSSPELSEKRAVCQAALDLDESGRNRDHSERDNTPDPQEAGTDVHECLAEEFADVMNIARALQAEMSTLRDTQGAYNKSRQHAKLELQSEMQQVKDVQNQILEAIRVITPGMLEIQQAATLRRQRASPALRSPALSKGASSAGPSFDGQEPVLPSPSSSPEHDRILS